MYAWLHFDKVRPGHYIAMFTLKATQVSTITHICIYYENV